MKTLVTGFGPFGDVVDNPSARIVEALADSGAPGHDLTARILPVSFERASAEIESLLVHGGFDLALLLGVAGKESEIRIETCGRNLDDARIPDCDGVEACGPIAESGPDVLTTSVECARIAERLAESGIPARLSDSAGSYVCNRVYYAALSAVAIHSLPTRCLFVHVPAHCAAFGSPLENAGMELDLQMEAIRAILDAFLLEETPREESNRAVAAPLS